MTDNPTPLQFGVSDRMIAALVGDKIIPEGQGLRVQDVAIDAANDRDTLVRVTMVATEDFLKCLTP